AWPARMAALGLQGLPPQGALELRLTAALAPLSGRAVQGRGRVDVQAESPHVAAHHGEWGPLGAALARTRGGAVDAHRERPARLRRHPLYERGLLRASGSRRGRDR